MAVSNSNNPSNGRPIQMKNGIKVIAAERPNTLGLTQRELNLLLDKLEALDAANGKPSAKRDFARWPFRHASINLRLVHPGGNEVGLRLACRNISRGGISLLHAGYIHPGSQVIVELPRLSGVTTEVHGTIVRCQHRRLTLHEIGVRFNHEIVLRDYVGGRNTTEIYSLERVTPEKLQGNILYVDGSDVDARIVQHYLRETSVAIKRAAKGIDAITELTSQTFDLILVDARLPDMKGTEMVAKIREMGMETPAILIAADAVGVMKDGLWDLQNVGILTKPMTQDQLLRVLAERLLVGKKDGESSTHGSGGNKALASAFASQLSRCAMKLEDALNSGESGDALDACLQIKGTAPTLGLSQVADSAEQIATVLAAGESLTTVEKMIRELVEKCRKGNAA